MSSEAQKERSRAYYQANKEKIKEKQKVKYVKQKELEAHRKERYEITMKMLYALHGEKRARMKASREAEKAVKSSLVQSSLRSPA